jgi:hypothetical protein
MVHNLKIMNSFLCFRRDSKNSSVEWWGGEKPSIEEKPAKNETLEVFRNLHSKIYVKNRSNSDKHVL